MTASETRISADASPDSRHHIVSRKTVGARLRALRQQRGLTLKRVSEASGVPISTLSKIELGQAALNYDKLMLLSSVLEADMTQLVMADGASQALAGQVLKIDTVSHNQYVTDNYWHKFLFSDISGKRMTPILATLFSREVGDFPDFVRHPGQEFAYVLSGHARIVFETGEVLDLFENEAAYFDSSVGHVYLSLGDEPARVLAVCTPEAL